ncbi:MAG: hypothetical protein M3Z27_06365, partial [Actinomycetota bacterium]|nr:hypothetical protein [Actinomycetota bacterium]
MSLGGYGLAPDPIFWVGARCAGSPPPCVTDAEPPDPPPDCDPPDPEVEGADGAGLGVGEALGVVPLCVDTDVVVLVVVEGVVAGVERAAGLRALWRAWRRGAR